ncbi:3-oxoacyl-ACP synthase [Chitinophaga parva]|uniref:3-oxoacyl-ACP synthase n=1 Tax=Chitinophaga parva TaxID=2169414 RepID=A0A2T7BIJ8_9BACT|nr:ketoacyl-ACP synthase III [Chitinophaga parva]PUZ26107.1 3-oxoacyl-ACP synthase [Chitinophaga parva]
MGSVIIGTGSYLPEVVKRNSEFESQPFYTNEFVLLKNDNQTIIKKFEAITGIEERRYASPTQNTSDLAAIAARKAIENSAIDPETLDLLIVAHNYGDISGDSRQPDTVPSLANRVKHALGIANPGCIAFDVLFGCPGWVLAITQTDAFFKAGMAKRALVIGAETLSRILDPFDRDSMIFSDGAGAVVMEHQPGTDGGFLHSHTASHSLEELNYLQMGSSYNRDYAPGTKMIKMNGRKVYEYALKHVPLAIKECIDKAGVTITSIKKIFIHQANEKMDEAILQALYKLYNLTPPPDIMPMSIHYLGNSSVATVPTLLDLVQKGTYPEHALSTGDLVIFASVGAGMNMNAVCYKWI